MSDQDNSRDEFVFEEEVNQEAAEYTKNSYEGSTENIKSLLQNKRLMIMLGSIVGLWVITYIFDSSVSPSVVEDELDSSLENVKTELGAGSETTQPTSNIVANQFSTVESTVRENSDGMDKINQDIANQNNSIETAHKNVNSINNKVNKLANDVSELHYQLKHILDIDRELFQKIGSIEEKLKKEEEKKKAALVKKEPVKELQTYFIRAVIEGRAWLDDSAGRSITIAIGDFVKDYGRIVNIYPSQGFIVTTSGRVIQFKHD